MSVSDNGSDLEVIQVLDENKNPPLLELDLSVSDSNKSNNLINNDSIQKENDESQTPSINLSKADKHEISPSSENVCNASKNSSFGALAIVSNANNNIDFSFESDTKPNVSSTKNNESQIPSINLTQADEFEICPNSENVFDASKNSSFGALADVSNANNNIDLSYESDTKPNVSFTKNDDLMNMSASEFNVFTNGVVDDNPPLPPETFDAFKHPDVIVHSPDKNYEIDCCESADFPDNNGINVEGEVFQDAVQFFKDPSSLQFLENLQTSEQTQSNIPRDSLYMTFDPLHKKFMQPSNPVINDIIEERVVIGAEINEPIKVADETPENKSSTPPDNHISNMPPRESFGNILLSFDSPMKTNSFRNSAQLENQVPKNVPRLYTEEELQQALKINELTMHEEFLKKQRELEEDAVKKVQDNSEKLNRSNKFIHALHEIITEFTIIVSDLKAENSSLSTKVASLESEKEKLVQDVKTSSEDLQSVEHTFSDFHKRYVQCKDMLKTYKDNEDHLRSQMENLNNQLEEQKQMNSVLQLKMEEAVEKANAEVTNAKKGGDAQIAVLRAQLKKSELKVSSLESDLKQVKIENDKLSSICDDLMAKVSES